MASRARGSLQLAASAGIGSLQEIPAPHPVHSPAGPGQEPQSSPLALEAPAAWGVCGRTSPAPGGAGILQLAMQYQEQASAPLGSSGGTQEGSPLAQDGCWSQLLVNVGAVQPYAHCSQWPVFHSFQWPVRQNVFSVFLLSSCPSKPHLFYPPLDSSRDRWVIKMMS